MPSRRTPDKTFAVWAAVAPVLRTVVVLMAGSGLFAAFAYLGIARLGDGDPIVMTWLFGMASAAFWLVGSLVPQKANGHLGWASIANVIAACCACAAVCSGIDGDKLPRIQAVMWGW